MAIVYEAEQLSTGRRVAVKVPLTTAAREASGVARDPHENEPRSKLRPAAIPKLWHTPSATCSSAISRSHLTGDPIATQMQARD